MRQSPTQQGRRGNGVVRAWALARHHHLGTVLAAEAATPLAILGGLLLWLLRLALAPASTLAGFRAWVLEECPVAPGRRAPTPGRRPHRTRGRRPRPPGSSIWSPNGTGLSPPSRCTASPGSAPTWPPSSA